MLDNFGLVVASFCVLFGGFFLYDGMSDATQVTKTIAGAALLSGGLMGAFLIARDKIIFWKTHGTRSDKGE